MKKQILISSFIATIVLGGTTIVALNDANAEKSQNNNLIATESVLTTTPKLSASKDETVYVITDESGNTKSKFIGSTIYDGAEELPFTFKITYFLDGTEISAKDLAKKSGHVKIVFSYESTAKYLGKKVPFVALTGLSLNHTNFKNIKLTNGKIVTETTDSYIIAGYATPGLNSNLGTDFLPDSFTLEADTTSFELSDSYTIFTNELISDIDTSKLNDLDSLTSSVYQLSDGLDQIIAGASELSNGLATALDGVKALHAGSETLADKLETATTGATELNDGLNYIVSNYNGTLQTGANTIITSTLIKLNANPNIQAILPTLGVTEITTDNYSTVLPQIIAYITSLGGDTSDLEQSKLLLDFTTGVVGYTKGVAVVSSGFSDLTNGLSQLSTGATTLSENLGTLVEGTTKLYNGSVTLKDSLTTFKTSGIDKLVNFASKDLANFTANVRSSVSAASSYKNFGNIDAKSVIFIVKTPSI